MKVTVLIIVLLHACFSISQSAEDEVHLGSFNTVLMDSLIFDKVNKVRKQHSLTKIYFSDSLDLDAKLHVKEMAYAGYLFYSERRVRAGECNLKYPIENAQLTYKELAENLVQKWILSPGHAKLILGEFFLYGGSAVGLKWDGKSDQADVFVCYRISYWP